MSTLRLILFDCDGTLVDSGTHIVSTMQAAFTHHGLTPPDDEAVRAIIGLSLPFAIEALHAENPAVHDELVTAYKNIYREAATREAAMEPLYPGVMRMLDSVSGEATLLGVATGKSRNGLNRIIRQHGLEGRFVTTKTADDAASKPSPDMVLQALSESGCDAARTVVVGDSAFDMQMARAAGAFAVGVSWGYQPPERLEAAGAHTIAGTMADLPAAIAGLVAP
ncbi:HAD-IA family hydrolase [Acuticoccus sp. MNP-M23]|uniref:HAD-IA family hydrolase n=1 Tax=Acuticoccus sp. MNP-M23 TaxID=3072793 RepID=UPI00281498BA|nr:HAD-IA family hydrolase [Acuticoccus sp. MNP-M23]WMS40874.1 HAD-IA family hydrolase [Acuticoccus sp. MNP-M23]